MDKTDKTLQLAEHIIRLRAQLLQAESELRTFLGGALASSERAQQRSPRRGPRSLGNPVSGQVKALLSNAGRPLAFGEIVDQVGGSSARLAARAALKKLRAKKEVSFRGGKYGWSARAEK